VTHDPKKPGHINVSPIFKHRLIGLTGTNGAGKGEVAAYLGRRGYARVSLSDVLRDRLRAAGRTESRDNLIAEGNALRKAQGPDILARLVLEKVHGPTVIDSIRNPHEVAFLRRQEGFFLVAVDAPPAVRFERVRKRGREESASTLEEFLAKERQERTSDPGAQQIDRCMRLADAAIVNDGPLAELHRRLEEIL
jgi:dephospho-CoA kinase